MVRTSRKHDGIIDEALDPFGHLGLGGAVGWEGLKAGRCKRGQHQVEAKIGVRLW
jgi:hypothetical protein